MTRELKVFLILAALGLGLILGLKFLFPLVAPFLLGISFACLIEPIVKLLETRCLLRRNLAVSLTLISVVLVSFLIVILVVNAVYQEAQRLWPQIPALVSRLESLANNCIKHYANYLSNLKANSGIHALNQESLTHILRSLVNKVYFAVTQLPQIMLTVILGGVTAYFFSRDKVRFSGIFYRCLPKSWRDSVIQIKNEIFRTMGQFLRVEFSLVLFTTLSTILVFKFLGLSGALAYGFLTGFLDFIPVLGIGLVYLPLAAVQTLAQNYHQAIWLLVSYFLLLIVRQLLEVKLIGENLKIHPLVSLIVFYLGMKFFGFAGIICAPMLLVTMRASYRVINNAMEVVTD